MTRYCPDCKQDKPVGAFGVNRARPDGIGPYCKRCNCNRVQRFRDGKLRPQSGPYDDGPTMADVRRVERAGAARYHAAAARLAATTAGVRPVRGVQ